MSDYEHTETLEPYEVHAGREILVSDENGNLYAGDWSRSLIAEGDEDELTLGYFDDPVRGENEPARLPIDALFRHSLYTGVTGYGKSTAVRNQLRQVAERGHGLAFFDPKGQDSVEFLKTIPEDRRDDVVWVEPGASDGENDELGVGFNLLKTSLDPEDDGYMDEVHAIAENVVSLLRWDGAWGATMDAVATAVVRQLVAAEEEYTLLDMYAILSDEGQRAAFADRYGDEIEQVYLKRLKENYDDEEFDPLLRRIRNFVENSVTRNMICARDGLAFGDIVRDDRILIVRTSDIPHQDIMAIVATSIVTGLWAARNGQDFTDIDPFFLALDEFDVYVTEAMDIGDILSKGRSLKFSVALAIQRPEQVSEEVRETFANIDNLFAFNPGVGNVSGASKLAQTFGCGANRLLDLHQYEFVARLVTKHGEKTEPFTITQLAAFPPLRDESDADALIEESITRYGVEKLSVNFEFSDYGIQTE